MINGVSNFIFKQKLLNLLVKGKEFEVVNAKTNESYIFYQTMDNSLFEENIFAMSLIHVEWKFKFGKYNLANNCII